MHGVVTVTMAARRTAAFGFRSPAVVMRRSRGRIFLRRGGRGVRMAVHERKSEPGAGTLPHIFILSFPNRRSGCRRQRKAGREPGSAVGNWLALRRALEDPDLPGELLLETA